MRFEISKKNKFFELFLLLIFFIYILIILIFIKSIDITNFFLLKEQGVFYTANPVYYNYLNYKNYVIHKTPGQQILKDNGKKFNNFYEIENYLGFQGWIKSGKMKKLYDLYFIDKQDVNKPVIKIIDIKIKEDMYIIKYIIIKKYTILVFSKEINGKQLNKYFF